MIDKPEALNEQSGDTDTNKLRGLYAITDEKLITDDNFSTSIKSVLQGGAHIIQYRDKSGNHEKRLRQARVIRSLCDHYNALCIINDDIELARSVDADGVHLGREDISLNVARNALGSDAVIGISCYNDIDRALTAQKGSADYVAFGSMFSSPTKPDAPSTGPDIINQARQLLNIPICAIGGITEKNISQLIANKVDMVAVISCLFASDNIEATAHDLSSLFK